jgi:spore germination protein YaaH
MAYDYSTEDTSPGPIAPLPWVEDVLKLAVSEIPRDKIILGVPTYGYDWSSDRDTQDLQWSDAQALAEVHSAFVTWDQQSQSPWFTYTDNRGNRHTVWYEDAHSLQTKIDVALRNQIRGIVLWRLGGEDPSLWEELRQAS